MITIQDCLTLSADKLPQLNALFESEYRPAAEQRGMSLIETRLSPPLPLQREAVNLWLRWQVTDVGAWWGMRAMAGTPEVAAFWQKVDALCESRERFYPQDLQQLELVAAQDTAAFQVQTRGHRETAQLALREGISDADVKALRDALNRAAELPGVEAVSVAENLAPEYAAGHYTFDLLFDSRASADAARASQIWTQHIAPALDQHCCAVHAQAMDTIGAGLRAAELSGAIKRTAFFRLLPGTDRDRAQRFEADLLEMPAQIPQILNWRLSRAEPLPWHRSDDAPWTYVWEQEFASLDDLLGPYMTHPHHWSHIDRWFDPESGIQAVDARLSHAFSPLSESLITREAVRGE